MIRVPLVLTQSQVVCRTLITANRGIVHRFSDADNAAEKCMTVAQGNIPRRKELQEYFGLSHKKTRLPADVGLDEAIEINGIPANHKGRVARIFKPAREATQSAHGNTKAWKIELDNQERWENPLMGWCSTGDPLSNLNMALKFATKEAAISFCTRNGWEYEVEEPHQQKVIPKNYGDNFAWNKRTRVSNK
uniref:NADH dehydrogenase [ubiquinone] iron-sulfur protein 4, mitochondrial n=1 Tax=Syphacia muris TaxID=451379 RepID=A0A0N5AGR7_9BILA